MSEKILAYKVDVNTKSLSDLEGDLEQINEQLKDVQIGSDAFKDLTKQAQATTSALNKVNSEIEGFTLDKKIAASAGAVTGLAGALAATVGTLGVLGVESEAFGKFEEKAASALAVTTGFNDMATGIKDVASNLDLAKIKAKIFGMTTQQAIIATGVGIFVVALGLMVAYWDDIVAGVEKFGQKVPIVGEAIKFIKDSFDALIESMRPALEWLGLIDTKEEALAKTVRATAVINAAATEKEIKRATARGASLKELAALERKLLEEKIAAAEAEEEIADAKFELELFDLAQQKLINAEKLKLSDEAIANAKAKAEEAKAIADDATQAEKDRLEAILDIQKDFIEKERDQDAISEQQKVELEKERQLAELDLLVATEEQKASIVKYYDDLIEIARQEDLVAAQEQADQIVAIEKDAADQKAALAQVEQDIKAQAINDTINATQAALSSLFGESKAIASANVIVDSGQAAVGIIKSSQSIPAPFNIPFQIAQFALLAATTAKSLKTINSAQPGGGGSGGGAGSIPGFSMPASNAIGRSSQLPPGAPDQSTQQQCIKTYVLSGDVSSSQEADAKINKKRSIGG